MSRRVLLAALRFHMVVGLLMCLAGCSLFFSFLPYDRMYPPQLRNGFGEPVNVTLSYGDGYIVSNTWFSGECVAAGRANTRISGIAISVKGQEKLALGPAELRRTVYSEAHPHGVTWDLRPDGMRAIPSRMWSDPCIPSGTRAP